MAASRSTVSLRAAPLPGPAPAANTTASAASRWAATSSTEACSRSNTTTAAPAASRSALCSGFRMKPATESPRLREQPFEDQGDLAVPAGDDNARHPANTCESSAKALNSNAFPAGSSRNIVHCSPDCPSKRTCGSITNSTCAAAQSVSQLVELRNRQDNPEVGDRDIVPVDRIVNRLGAARREMGDDLVAVQVPVDPRRGAAALFETEYLAVKLAGGGKIVDRHREVETRDGGVKECHISISRPPRAAGPGLRSNRGSERQSPLRCPSVRDTCPVQ